MLPQVHCDEYREALPKLLPLIAANDVTVPCDVQGCDRTSEILDDSASYRYPASEAPWAGIGAYLDDRAFPIECLE